MSRSPAQRRYQRSVLLLSLSYALLLIATAWFFRAYPGVADPAAYVIAAFPALPIVGIVAVLGRYMVEERDEYLRMLRVRQALIATAITLGLSTVWGFVEDAGLLPHVPAFYVAILWFAGFGIGAGANRIIEGRRA